MSNGFLKTRGCSIVDGAGKQVFLRGVNLGGWLMMEGYFMHAPNAAEQVFKKNFLKHLGPKALEEMEGEFRRTFITLEDMKALADWGVNCVRLPFNCRLIERKPYVYDLKGAVYLDEAIGWAKKNGIKVILDMHAAPGAQNHDWHSDSLGKAELWTKAVYRKRACALWEFLADRYKDEDAVAGYDLLNEAVVKDIKLLNGFYADVTRAIRGCDRNHILFVEGSQWAQNIEVLEDLKDDNWAYSIHYYHPIEYSFNFVHFLSYPLGSSQGTWDRDVMRRHLDEYVKVAQKKQRPVHVGEFGVNDREGRYNEDVYLKDLLQCFQESGFHWSYWTYKAVKNHMFPDGVFSYYPNSPWVNRHGPKSGWDTWSALWPQRKGEIIESWKTKNFTANAKVLAALKKYL